MAQSQGGDSIPPPARGIMHFLTKSARHGSLAPTMGVGAMGIKFTPQMTVPQFERLFPTDDACKLYLQKRRWPKKVCCARCGNEKVSPVSTMPFHWQCTECADKGGYRFSVLVGTIFENTNVPMKTWFKVIYLMLTSKKGISALQIHRMMGFGSYRTAWYLCHRVRAGLADPQFRKLMGIVEVDETYIGGKNKNRHWDKKQPGTIAGKVLVAGVVSRKGNVVARVHRKHRHQHSG
ncbi:MAG: IS1595 family transposase [Xanthobacteraceae bacterium]